MQNQNQNAGNIQAQRTVRPYAEMVDKLFKRMDTDAATLVHATIGMSGEAAELLDGYRSPTADIGNIKEELGDWRFYAQHVWTTYGWEIDSFIQPVSPRMAPDDAVSLLVIESGNMLDASKKEWIYGKEVDVLKLYDSMGRALYAYLDLCDHYGWTDEIVQDANRTKLAKRYPEGVYSNEAAIARADKEVAALEKARQTYADSLRDNPPYIITGNAA